MLATGATEVTAEFQDIREYREAVAAARAAGAKIWLATLRIQKPDEAGLFRALVKHEPDGLLPAAYDLARSFVVGRSPVALGLAKRLLYRNGAAADPLEAHLSDSLAMYYSSIGDGKEGVVAFLEKRAPRFTGRASELPPTS